MRSVALLLGLSVVVTSGLVACAPSSEDDSADDTGALTGGSKAVESPVVFLFDTNATDKTTPSCAGALIGAKVAVTAKSCAKEGMLLGRAGDKNGKGTQAKITAVHVPEDKDADIAVVELDREMGGNPAVITHAPLKDGYAIDSFSAIDQGGLFSPDKGDAASIAGKLASETDKHSTLFPAKGSQICAGDVGAPVCSSTGFKIFNYNISGTCGLSGLVVGAEPIPPVVTDSNGVPTSAPPASSLPDKNGCSAGGWKVAQLGRYAEFLKQYAPDAFKPTVIDAPILRNFPTAAPGLWGYKTGGTIAQCTIETPKLDSVAINTDAKLTAKVSFTKMDQRATAYARFGIAPKSDPTQMRWLPTKTTSALSGTSFTAEFQGAVQAGEPGDYVVGFRVSANGGETWTQCDLDGSENGYDADKILALKITATPTAPPSGGTTPPSGGTTPPSGGTTPPSSSTPSGSTSTDGAPAAPASDSTTSSDTSYQDNTSGDSTSDYSDEDAPVAHKKSSDTSSCSVSMGGTSTKSGLPVLGLLLGLVAVVRRRR